MQPIFTDQPILLGAFLVSLLLWRVMETSVDIMSRRRLRLGTKRQDKSSFAILTVLLLGGLISGTLLAFQIPTTALTFGRPFLFWLGILLINVGIALRFYSIRVLGAYFTTTVAVAPTQTVITSGPYRLIRHPSYTGLLLTLLGYAFCLTNWVSLLIIMGCALAGLSYRISVEERVLQQQLGQPYQEYMQHTKRLIPFIV